MSKICDELFKRGRIALNDMNEAIDAAVSAAARGNRSAQLKAERDFRQARGVLFGIIAEYNGKHCGTGDLMFDLTGDKDEDPSNGDSRIPRMPKL